MKNSDSELLECLRSYGRETVEEAIAELWGAKTPHYSAAQAVSGVLQILQTRSPKYLPSQIAVLRLAIGDDTRPLQVVADKLGVTRQALNKRVLALQSRLGLPRTRQQLFHHTNP